MKMTRCERCFVSIGVVLFIITTICGFSFGSETGRTSSKALQREKIKQQLTVHKHRMQTIKAQLKTKKMSSQLHKIISRHDASREKKDTLLFEEQQGVLSAPAQMKIIMRVKEDDDSVEDEVHQRGGRVIVKRRNLYAVEMPLDRIEELVTAVNAIMYAHLPEKGSFNGIVSEGVELSGAKNPFTARLTGRGVKIAVIDAGFKGLSAAQANGDLPAEVVTRDFSDTGLQTEYKHGTACAEIVHDMAPGAELHLLKVSYTIDLFNALDYCKDSGIDIISLSLGWYGTGPGNGTGPFHEAFDEVHADGLLSVTSAGNNANSTVKGMPVGRHWKGTFHDSDYDDIHEFIPGDTDSFYNVIRAIPDWDDDGNSETREVSITMRWNDWPYADIDYDVYLFEYNYDSGEIIYDNLIDWSTAVQDGSQLPLERIGVDIPDDEGYIHYYAVVVMRDTGESSGTGLEIYLGGTSRFIPFDIYTSPIATSSSSLTEPADAASVFSVGAVDYLDWETGPQEPFSSQGPTNAWAGHSARIKPDICGPDGVSGYTYGTSSFFGTSAATPHVAGACALVKQAYPEWSPDQIRDFLASHARDLGTPGKDTIYGSGLLNLPVINARAMPWLPLLLFP